MLKWTKIPRIGIYKITSPSDRIYIGQSLNLYRRYNFYRNIHCKGQPNLYNSLKFYGWDKHVFEIIEECNPNLLDEREIFWKQYYVNLLGWKKMLFINIHDSGGGPKSEETKQKISQNKTGKNYKLNTLPKDAIIYGYINGGETTYGLAKKYNVSLVLIKKLLVLEGIYVKNKNKNTKNQTPEQIQKAINNFKKYNSKPIEQYDLEGNFIKEWSSITEASKILKIDQSSISRVLLGNKIQVKGFKFKYKLI